MSGHSKWANIKNRKGAQDKKRSEAFTKISKNILTAIRMGGGNTNPEVNGALKVAIDKAREVNMPKENIQRLLDRFEERKANLVSVILEGYGPFGVPVIVETETDNKNRILGEIKLIFRNYGGSLGESNSVMFQFDRVGEVEFDCSNKEFEEKQLELIDLGAVDFDEKTVIIESGRLSEFSKRMEASGLKPIRSELVYKIRTPVQLSSEDDVARMMDFIDELESNDDVLGVFAGFDYN